MKKLSLYCLRWQLSTPILALVPMILSYAFSVDNPWIVAIVANFIGSLIFFPIDKKIFNKQNMSDFNSELDLNTVKAIKHLIAGRLHNLRNTPRDITQIIQRDTPVILESKVNENRTVNLQEMLFIVERDAIKITDILLDIECQ